MSHIFSKDFKYKDFFFMVGEVVDLFFQTVKASFTSPFYFHKFLEQMYFLGIQSIPITIVIGLITGLVMTLQFGYGLAKFGGTLYVPAIVSLSIVRELGPIFTSLLIAGRIGSGISAELGAMNVSQQIDAIRALGTSPIRILVVPRFLAALFSVPLLATLSSIVGIGGGLIIAHLEFNMPAGFYFNKVLATVRISDFIGSYLKCCFFSCVITTLACYKGFKTKEGTRGVGNATTWVVVTSSIIILISDFFLSKFILLVVGE